MARKRNELTDAMNVLLAGDSYELWLRLQRRDLADATDQQLGVAMGWSTERAASAMAEIVRAGDAVRR